MPNWCCQNLAIKGSANELQNFADIINSLPTRENCYEFNGFGKMWIGNLINALEGDWKQYPHRGTVDGCPNCFACLFGPDKTNEKAKIGDDGFLRISMTTAWSVPLKLYEFIKSKYPSFDIFYYATDEFGNFHVIHDPNNEANFEWFHLNDGHESYYYTKDEDMDFLKDLQRTCTDLNIPKDILTNPATIETFERNFYNWCKQNTKRENMSFFICKAV